MVKKLNNILNCLLLLGMSACTSMVKNEVQKEGKYIKKNVSIMYVTCDSIEAWLNEKAWFNKTAVFNQIGIKDSLTLTPTLNSEEINIEEGNKTYNINRTDILISNHKTTWSVYYTNELKELIFIEIKSEDPNSTIYFSNNPETKRIFCHLIGDSSFILNKFKLTEPVIFTPPNE